MTDPRQEWWPFRGPAGTQDGGSRPAEDPTVDVGASLPTPTSATAPDPTLVLPEATAMPGPGYTAVSGARWSPPQPTPPGSFQQPRPHHPQPHQPQPRQPQPQQWAARPVPPPSWQQAPAAPVVAQRAWPPPPPRAFGPPPGHYQPYPSHLVPPRPPRRTGLTILVVIVALVAGSLIGIGVVKALEPGTATPATSTAPTATSSSGAPSQRPSVSPASSTSPSSSATSTYTPFKVPPTKWAALPKARPHNSSERRVQANELYALDVPASDSCPAIPRRVASGAAFRDLSRKILDCQHAAWKPVFADMGMTLSKPKLVIFSSRVTTKCGSAGPEQSFYCPASQEIYLSESRFESSQEWWRLHFANTLVHEFIHHVQNEAQILDASYDLDMNRDQRTRRVELQAYCLTNRVTLITPAFTFGQTDYQTLKEWTEGESSRTHGSVSSRRHWWMRGLEQQKISGCNTWVVPASQVT